MSPELGVAVLRSRLRDALTTAMKQRQTVAVRALRATIAAIDNAEAVAVAPRAAGAQSEGPIAGAHIGLGAAEVDRRVLTAAEAMDLLAAEIDERRSAASTYADLGEAARAAELRTEADVLATFLDDGPQPVDADGCARNLAAFVAATAGRRGAVAAVRGGVVTAGPVPVANGFVNAAVPTDAVTPAGDFLDDAEAFFATHEREFVLWLPQSRSDLRAEALRRGARATGDPSPAMVVHEPLPVAKDPALRVTTVSTDEQGALFADLAERGYEIPGLGWLLTNHDAFNAPGTTWAIAWDGEQPLSVACGFHDGPVGGVYYVATPPELRGRGAAAVVTTWVTNDQFARGADVVTLQASRAGFPIYERLGFATYDGFEQHTMAPAAHP